MLQTSPLYCYQLVTAIERELGRSLVPSVREAFLRVPRHLFVQQYYENDYIKTVPSVSDETAWEEWLSTIYSDQALTTQVDVVGLPTSSSSQPSVMAVMLEQLTIRPGMRILEIGTGTGYNAALVAVLVGDSRLVTTIDLDPTLIDRAHPYIERVVGPGMTINTWNGIDGYAPNAPYDRIIATGSFLPVPLAWIEQLKTGGKLVMDLRGRLGGGLITVTKDADGTATGRFLTELRNISFMGLRSSLEAPAIPSLPRGYQKFPLQERVQLSQDDPAYACASHFVTYEQFHAQDDEVNIILQWAFPHLGIKWKGSPENLSAVLTDYSTQTVATIQKQEQMIEITVCGERPLWSEVCHVYQAWLDAGKPGRECYTLCIDERGGQVMNMTY